MPQGIPQPLTRRQQLRAAIAAQEAEVRQLRSAEHLARNLVQSRRRTVWQRLTEEDRLQLRLVWDLCGDEAVLKRAVAVVCAGGRTPHEEDLETAMQAVAESVRASLTLGEAAAAELAERPNGRRVFRAARVAAEVRTVMWIAGANARGVAPATLQLARILSEQWPAGGRGVPARCFLMRLRRRERARNTWASRFRRRWCLSWRRLSARTALPRELAAQKARGSVLSETGARFRNQKGAQKWGHFLAPFFGPPIYAMPAGTRKRGQKTAPLFGPHFA